jgi:hypothetical protein
MKKRTIVIILGTFMLLLTQPAHLLGAQENQENVSPAGISTPNVSQAYIPLPHEQRTAASEVLGSREGHIHPFLSVAGYFTDNFFNTHNNQESELYTVITPGIWVALPASRQQMLQVATRNTAPGGLEVSRFRIESDRRFQGYALYRANIEEHDRFTSENNVYQRAEGLLQGNLRGGLSLELIDVYQKDHDPLGTGNSVNLVEFDSNLVSTLVSYQVGPRLRLRADYSNYYLSYSSDQEAFRDRDDNSASAFAFYRVTGKTSAFLQYDYIDINYRKDILQDSTEQHYFVGAQWRVTAKTRARLRVGLGVKDFSGNGGTRNDFIATAQLDHRFTPKTSVSFRAYRRPNETDDSNSQWMLTNRVEARYLQRLTARIMGSANIFYWRNSYEGQTTVGGQTGRRIDDYYSVGVSFGYAFRRWLNMNLGYSYVDRDSNFNQYDYRTNYVFLSATAAL